MTKTHVTAAVGALLALGMLSATVPAAADPLSPWEKFCLHTSAPGKALGNCLDGLPSRGGRAIIGTPGPRRSGIATRTSSRFMAVPRRSRR